MSTLPKTAKGPRGRHDAQFWASLIAEHAEAGGSLRQFAAHRGLSYSTLCRWRRRLSTEKGALARASGAQFLELTPMPVPARAEGWDVELEFGAGAVVRLRLR